MKKLPTLNILIVNWNAGNLLAECINTIQTTLKDSFILNEVVVVDNNSSDDSLNNTKTDSLPLRIIRNKTNVGFARACNQAALDSNSDYILMLNPDTKLFEDSLQKPLEFMEKSENRNIGICGIKLIDENNNIARNCARFPSPLSMFIRSLGLDKIFPRIFKGHFMIEWDHNDSRIVDQVMGAFYLIRGELFKSLNGYDERFFVYYEDLDFALRAKKIGYNTYYLNDACVYHKGGGTSEQVKSTRLYYNLRSKILYANKHFGKLSFIFVAFGVFLFEPCSRLLYVLLKAEFNSVREIVEAYRMLIKYFFFRGKEN